MNHWNHQRDVSNTVTTYLLFSHLNTTSVTNNTLVTDTLILTTSTLVILYRTENTLTEETITLWFVRTVVDCFWFQNLSVTTLKDGFWCTQRDSNLAESTTCVFIAFSKSHNAIVLKPKGRSP